MSKSTTSPSLLNFLARAVSFTDKQVAPVIRRCQEIDGQYLFCYRDDEGEYHPIESTDVNEYLRDVGRESITAKDFRTWWGSVAPAVAYLPSQPYGVSRLPVAAPAAASLPGEENRRRRTARNRYLANRPFRRHRSERFHAVAVVQNRPNRRTF